MRNIQRLQNAQQIRFRSAALAHLPHRVRIDDLLAQRAMRQVRALGDVEDVLKRRLDNRAAVDRPQAAEDAEQAALAAAVGPDDEQVGAALDGKGEREYEYVAVG